MASANATNDVNKTPSPKTKATTKAKGDPSTNPVNPYPKTDTFGKIKRVTL